MKKHGGMIGHRESDILDFSANIHPYGMPGKIEKALQDAVKDAICYPDPDCVRLRREIAKKHQISEAYIICGNGAADLIFQLAFVLQARKILLPVPAFIEYEEAFTACFPENVVVDHYKMDLVSFQIGEEILDRMDSDTDILILCNPNNPTGLLIDQELLDRILERAKEKAVIVLLDECFLDFVVGGRNLSKIHDCEQYPNLFLLRSFTKMYGIPGVRLGYGICSDTDLLRRMKRISQTWSVSHLAQAAGIAACSMTGYEEQTAFMVAQRRQWMRDRLQRLGFQVWEGTANYLFFRAEGCTDLYDTCLERGICIRHCDNYEGIGADYYRVAIRRQQENERLVQVLTEWKEGV